MLLQIRNLRLFLLPPLVAGRVLTQDPTASAPSFLLITTLLLLFLLLGVFCYDKRHNFRWLTAGRHCIGECVRRARQYRRRSMDKSMRVQTEEVLPTPKTTHIEPENQRPFIESEPSVREPVSPSDPIAQEQLQQRRQVDLKNVFQVKEHKGLKGKPKKEKKSKSKLKSRLQSTAGNEEEREREGEGQEEENSFSQEMEVVGSGNGVEDVVRGSQVQ